ncbi:MAG: hypothetical protein P8011_00270 [Acidihalobacter sp.]
MSRSAARELSNLIEGYGILGEAGHSLRCGMVIPFARAFGDVVSPDGDGTFAIGYDVRASSPSLAEAASLGLRSGGHHVTHIGACTTPQLEWYVASTGLRGGLMITGGCAPPQHNGLRLYRQDAVPVAAAEVLSALSIDDLNELFAQACNPVLHQDHPLQAYAAFLRRRLEPANFIKLCLDVGNGLAGAEFEAVMAHYRQLRLWRVGFTPATWARRWTPTATVWPSPTNAGTQSLPTPWAAYWLWRCTNSTAARCACCTTPPYATA